MSSTRSYSASSSIKDLKVETQVQLPPPFEYPLIRMSEFWLNVVGWGQSGSKFGPGCL